MSVFEALNDVIASVNGIIETYVWYIAFVFLVGIGLYFTIRSGGVQLSHLGEACRVAFSGVRENKGKQTISSFQVFCVSLGAQIGVGNIAGVAVAIVSGSPGAIFWMWVFAIIGAATSFVECTLGQIYKEKKEDGLFHGGPAYYIKNGLGKPKFAAFVAVLIIFTYGLMFTGVQANTATLAFSKAFGMDQVVFAVAITVFAALIIFGGIKRVAKASVWMVPAMAMLWMILCLIVVLVNFTQVPLVIQAIFSYAFGVQAFVGGGIGAAIMWGLKRCVFANEAGIGSVPNVSSSAHVKHPVKQGLIQSLGVLIDTLVICSATAFVVLIYTNGADYANSGAELVQEAMSNTFLGAAGPYVIALFIVVFAFSSLISYYSMSEANAKFLTKKKEAIVILRVAVVVIVFVASMMSMQVVWDLADTFQALMGIFNIGVLIFLAKHAFEALKDYFDQRAGGVEEPVFNLSSISNAKGITCWPDNTDEDRF